MLTRAQVDHFDVFGFLHLSQVFKAEEIDILSQAGKSVCSDLLGHVPTSGDVIWHQPFVEGGAVCVWQKAFWSLQEP